jgi:hypothetical protein
MELMLWKVLLSLVLFGIFLIDLGFTVIGGVAGVGEIE